MLALSSARNPQSVTRPARFDLQPATSPAAASPAKLAVVSTLKPRQHTLPTEASKPKPAEPVAKALRFHLRSSSPVVDAPTIGPKIAGRLEQVGIVTVGDLLLAEPAALSAKLKQRHMTEETVRTWQHEATLVCRIPELRGHDAQLFVAAGITDPEQLWAHTPEKLFELLTPVIDSPAGKRILRNQSPPNLEELAHWITSARAARSLKAA